MVDTKHLDYTRRLEYLLEVCRTLATNLDLKPLLNTVIETASDLTHSEKTYLLLLDNQKAFLKVTAAPFYLLETLAATGVQVERSFAGLAVLRQAPVIYHHQEVLSPEASALDWEVKQKCTSLLAVPLIFKGEILGVLEALNKIGDTGYSQEDVTTLEVLASQAAAAIHSNNLIQGAEDAFNKMKDLDRLKSDFIAIASHELRTPLGLIIGHAHFLNETATPEQKADLDVIARSAERMRGLIEEFGDIKAITGGIKQAKLARVNVNDMIQHVLDDFRKLAEQRQIRLAVEMKQKDLMVEGDGEKLTVALRSLVKNALDYTNAGGLVKVTAEPLPGYIKIAVLDNGIGIPAVELESIFKRFYQVEKHLTRKHGGMGLGLSIAREMVELHGGKLQAESVEGKGSRFTILLPLNAAQVSAAERVFLK